MQPADKQPGGQASPGYLSPARVPGGIEDRLDEVLGHEGSPYPSNYEAMAEGIEATKALARRCRSCRGTGLRRFTEKDRERRKRVLDRYDEDIRRTESERHRLSLEAAKRWVMTEEFPTEDECPKCDGTGWIYSPSSKPLHDMFATERCGPCRGCGEVVDDDHDDMCLACSTTGPIDPEIGKPRRMGYHVTRTARPRAMSCGGSSWSGQSATDDPLDALPAITAQHTETEPEMAYEYGRIQRVIRELRKENAVIAEAATIWYGPASDRWKLHKWGRRFALWPLTEAGAALAREASISSTIFLPIDRIASERNAEEAATTPNVRRRHLIREADRQARLLEGLMRDAIARIEL